MPTAAGILTTATATAAVVSLVQQVVCDRQQRRGRVERQTPPQLRQRLREQVGGDRRVAQSGQRGQACVDLEVWVGVRGWGG